MRSFLTVALGCVALCGSARATPYDVADRAAAGNITVVNVPWQFPKGKVDWLFNPTREKGPLNHEWLWQLNRMYFWQDMAKAYQATHDEKYARAFADQLAGWLDQTGGIPAEKDYNAPGSPWRTIEEGIRLMMTWPPAWDAFKNSPAFPKPLKRRFVETMRAQARHLLAHRTSGNWLLMEMNGVYTFASKFAVFPECADWRKRSARIFADAIRAQILPDGLHDELSPDYHAVAYLCAMPLYETAKKYGTLSDLPADYLDVLRLGVEGPIAMTTPAFTQPRFNDCYTIPLGKIMRGVSKCFPARRDFLWAATEGREGEPPQGATASRFLPWAGFVVMRTDWSRDATYLCFDVGPLGVRHYHQDKLSFNLYKGNEELVFDDGGGHYEISPERHYGLSGYDHSTLLVDGLAQTRRGPLRSKQPIDAHWITTPERDSAVGLYDQGFGPKERRLARHRRKIVFDKKADIFTLTDDARSADGSNHVYQLLFQLPTTHTTILDNGRRLVAHYGKTYDLELTVVKGGTLTAVSAQRTPRLSGWYIGRHDHSVEPATTVTLTAPTARDHRFVTTLHPVRVNSAERNK